jgi:serine/threonine protein kinase
MSELSPVPCDESGAVPLPSAGDVVSGKYRLIRPLAEGGMGIVFEALHLRLRQGVAIKYPRRDAPFMSDAMDRFEREARASGRMRGPHVVRVLDVDTDLLGRPYMVMELLFGCDLEAELRARGSLSIAQAIDWTLQACAAVAQAHSAGIVHRDLKPSNLFLAEEAGTRVVKVLDFGIAMMTHDPDGAVAPTSPALGTPPYMSPEQVCSAADIDGRTDIWSLGVILYELIMGAPPFRGTTTAAIAAIVAGATPSLREIRPDVPQELERAIMTALAKSPANRFPSAEAFGAALIPFASAAGIEGPFSLRPSRRALEVACSTIVRLPSAPRANNASELLKIRALPERVPSATSRPRGASLRALASTLAITVGLGGAVTLAFPSSPRAAGRESAPRTGGRESKRETSTRRGEIMAGADGVETAGAPGRSPRACREVPQVDCRNPSGSSGAGGRSIRRSSEP